MQDQASHTLPAGSGPPEGGSSLDSGLPPRPPFLQRLHPVAFAILSLILVFFLYQVVAGGITLLLANGKITSDNVSLVRWSTLIGQLVFLLVPTLVLVRLRTGTWLQYFRIHLPEAREVIVTVVAVFALQQVLQCYMFLQEAIPLPAPVKEIVDQFKQIIEETYRLLVQSHSAWEFLGVVIVVALVPSITEEFLFRGLVQGSFEEAAGGLRAAILSGVIFGAYHLNPFSFVPLISLGIYFGFLVYRSQNIALAVSAHFFNNFLACVAAYLQLDDDFVAFSPAHSPSWEAILVNFVVFGMVFLAASYYFVRITSPVKESPDH
jgi:membrane protease YdiL (CAAX protease family)